MGRSKYLHSASLNVGLLQPIHAVSITITQAPFGKESLSKVHAAVIGTGGYVHGKPTLDTDDMSNMGDCSEIAEVHDALVYTAIRSPIPQIRSAQITMKLP